MVVAPHPRHLAAFGRIADDGPEAARAFFAWYGEATSGASLGGRVAALIAVAVAHVRGCPFCIDAWTGSALGQGCDSEELMAVVHLAAAVQAEHTLGEARLCVDQVRRHELRGSGPPEAEGYRHGGLAELDAEVEALSGAAAGTFAAWCERVGPGSILGARTTAAVALGVAHVLASPSAIARASDRARAAGLTPADGMAAVQVAAAMQAGVTLVHATLMRERLMRERISGALAPEGP